MIWHSTESSAVLQELNVDEKKGLANGVAEQRLETAGWNVLSNTEKPGFGKRILDQLKNKVVIALIVTAVLSFIVSLVYKSENAYAALLIIAIVVINALISAWQVHRCDDALENIKNATTPSARVMREGMVKVINSAFLVPGDILLLEEGDYISADARLLECNEFRCNESVITGDEIPVEKDAEACAADIAPVGERRNMVFSGTNVAHGTAKAVVVATGLHTEMGHTVALTQQTGKQILPLESELTGLGKMVNVIVLIVCLAVFVIGVLQNFSSGHFADMTFRMLVNAIALAVAAIPEGLPAIATVVLAVGVERFVAEKIVIKDATVPERLSRTDVICSDKTGVLTRNKMELTRIFDGEKTVSLGEETVEQKTALILQLAAVCSTLQNDSTENAIQNACLTYNAMSQKDVEDIFPRLGEIPFDPERKTMTVITMINEKPFAIVKGAPENVVPCCDGCDRELILKQNEEMANDGMRILCIALRPLDSIPANPNAEEIEQGLTFAALLGFFDPPRDTVIENIAALGKAGVRTLMITGDHLTTASAIARRIGILRDGTKAISGEELAEISDEELADTIEEYTVFARVAPGDKLRIVKALRACGHTVTITGDSIFDAEALAAADVGCAVGRFGTDVAKGSADVVITHNRFDHLLYAVRESRGLFANVRKSVHYLLSCNLSELLTVLVGMLVFSKMPITAVALLWINLLTDCAPALAISMEKAESSVMNGKARKSFESLFTPASVVMIVLQGIFIAAMTLTAYSVGAKTDAATAGTMAFGVLGLSQLFHCFNHKLDGTVLTKKLFSNRFMNYSLALTFFIVIFLLLTPAGMLFGMTVLSAKRLLLCLLLGFLVIPFTEIMKGIARIIENRLS